MTDVVNNYSVEILQCLLSVDTPSLDLKETDIDRSVNEVCRYQGPTLFSCRQSVHKTNGFQRNYIFLLDKYKKYILSEYYVWTDPAHINPIGHAPHGKHFTTREPKQQACPIGLLPDS